MSPASDRRARRRQETRDEIVAAAWGLAREHGLAGLSLRDLGQRVGMRAQSLYSYFGSKNEIYDAMFRDANLQFLAAVRRYGGVDGEPGRVAVRRWAHAFFDFCTADPVRYQLLFQRTVPGFEPSADSYAVAVMVLDLLAERWRQLGVTDPQASDLWTAVVTGLTDQQISNDPGGDRWGRLVDRTVDMVLREIAPHLLEPST